MEKVGIPLNVSDIRIDYQSHDRLIEEIYYWNELAWMCKKPKKNPSSLGLQKIIKAKINYTYVP